MPSKSINDLITETELIVDRHIRFGEKNINTVRYWLGRLESLRQARACRLTDAESAVIEAAMAMTGPCSPRLALARSELRRERKINLPLAERVIDDGYLADVCPDCGSGLHTNRSEPE